MLSSLLLATGAPAADEITSLPGWSGALPSKWYSGYVNVTASMDREMLVHYVYIESEGDAAHDPTILWTNGGPGASSMFGLLVELGPLILNENSVATPEFKKSGVPTLYRNDFGWSKLGGVLMFDWPPPVGFSYCDGKPAGDGNSCGPWDDERMAKATYAALAGWYEKFPERKAADLYLTGESYAGIYVPKLAQQILSHADPAITAAFKGFAVGDGCLGTETTMCGGAGGPWFHVLFLYGHGQVSNALFDDILATCGMDYLKFGGKPPAGCPALLGRVAVEAGGYYDYNLYDDCIYQDDLRRRRLSGRRSLAAIAAAAGTAADDDGFTVELARRTVLPPTGRGYGAAVNDYVCGGGPAQDVWVNQSAVRAALHVPTNSLFFSGDNGAGMTYVPTEKNLMPFYQHVAKNTSLRVLVYNGDTDPGLNSQRAENWTAALGFEATQSWRPWTMDNCLRVGGYVTRYEKDRFDFLTIRGSGHMVPQFKPAQALEFLSTWLHDKDYKPYVSKCTAPPK